MCARRAILRRRRTPGVRVGLTQRTLVADCGSCCCRLLGMTAILTELWVYWLQLAARHSAEARQLREHSLRGPIGPDKIEATLEELTQSMVAISCAASAIDGFAAAIREVTGQVSPARTPRPQQVLALIGGGFDVSAHVAAWQPKVDWLFDARNALIHADPRTDSTWRHPSGIDVAAIAEDVNMEAADRALSLARIVIDTSLNAPPLMDGGSTWAVTRRRASSAALSK